MPTLYDAHCHLSPNCSAINPCALADTFHRHLERQSSDSNSNSSNSNRNDAVTLFQVALMSTNQYDAELVLQFSDYAAEQRAADGHTGPPQASLVIPCLGIHPWYAHLLSLPASSRAEGVSKNDHYRAVFAAKDGEDFPQRFLDNLPPPLDAEKYFGEIQAKIDKLRQNQGGASAASQRENAQSGGESQHHLPLVIVGEIGIDKLSRVPWGGYLGNPDFDDAELRKANGSPLSPYRISMDHQLYIFSKHLEIAYSNNLPVSVHCVKAHGSLHSTVLEFMSSKKKEQQKSPDGKARLGIPAICLHSYTGSIEQAQQWVTKMHKKHEPLENTRIFFSFSNVINNVPAPGSGSNTANSKRHQNFALLIASVPDDAILIETDLPLDKYYPQGTGNKDSGDSLDGDPDASPHYSQAEDLRLIFELICRIKKWEPKQGNKILIENWNSFKNGAQIAG